jgi:hypothetical protein
MNLQKKGKKPSTLALRAHYDVLVISDVQLVLNILLPNLSSKINPFTITLPKGIN